MANVVNYAAQIKGTGAADGTMESFGTTRPGIALKYNQFLAYAGIVFTSLGPSIYPWIKPALAPGASAHLINMATGMPAPYMVPQGYTLTVIEQTLNFDQDIQSWLFFDGFIIAAPATVTGGNHVLVNRIVGYNTALLDPLALSPHTIDYVVYNKGLSPMQGGIEVVFVLEEIGSPPWPTKKDCKCQFCGEITNVPAKQTIIVCQSCKKTFVVYAPDCFKGSL